MKPKAAIESYHSEHTRGGKLPLPRFSRTIKGWQQMSPMLVRRVVPESLVFGLRGHFMHVKERDMALLTALSFNAYLRPSEVTGLYPEDIVSPFRHSSRSSAFHTVVLAPMEREVATKTGAYDESVILDCPREPWLGPQLQELAKPRTSDGAGDFDGLWGSCRRHI